MNDPYNPPVAPTLYIATDALAYMVELIRSSRGEVNGFGLISPTTGGHILASPDDVIITDQEVKPGAADAAMGDVVKAFDDAALLDRDQEFHLQWHSHPGEAYFSSTDMANVSNFGCCGAIWVASMVFARDGSLVARYDQYSPVRLGGPMPWQIFSSRADLRRRAVAQVAQHVRLAPPDRKAGTRRRSGALARQS